MSETTDNIIRTMTHEYVLGHEVYAYAYWENGKQERENSRFASHWSTPSEPFVRLFTEGQLRLAILGERERCAKIVEEGFPRKITDHYCPHKRLEWEDCDQCSVDAIRGVTP